MGRPTEADIFDLSENFRLAAEDCEKLARLPKKGRAYTSLRNKLELLEGACRQAVAWRDDARWLHIGMIGCAVLFASPALAQSSLIQNGAAAPGHAPMYVQGNIGAQVVVTDSG